MRQAHRGVAGVVAGALLALGMPVLMATTAQAAQPVPNHGNRLVPDVPRKDTPRISNGEIWDIEVVPQLNRVFIAGSFTSLANTKSPTTTIQQAGLASYNLDTGLIDTSFRPKFNGGVNAVEASPDGTKLFVAGSFSTVNGVAEQKVASLNLTTGAPVSSFSFSKSTNNAANALAVTNSTVYVGGKFTRINGVLKSGLAAVSASTGAVDTSFSNDITGGIGVNGALTVQQLKLTHDDSKLLVVHTGRQIAGQDRLGMGLIDTATKQLLPWRSRLWDDNLARVGGVTRIYGADIAPDDSYFVVTSGSGGDAPPISDTVVAYKMAPTGPIDDVQPIWIHRSFDSVYSVAITEKAVYIGGHFSWNESPTSDVPWPGLDNVGYGTGQGLSGYGLGDQVVRRDHLGALDPATGTALEWYPISNSFEGNKALEATPRGLFSGGDAMFQGGVKTGRVAFFDFNSVPAPSTTDTTITTPIEGRVEPAAQQFTVSGTATSPAGVRAVNVQLQDRDTSRWLQADGVTWGTKAYNKPATLSGTGANRTWSTTFTVPGNHALLVTAATTGTNGTKDTTKAQKKIETFSTADQTPSTNITGPSGIQTSTSFTMTGTATDDHGVSSLSYWFRDENNQYLQADGTVAPVFNTFRGVPDVVGATNATWSYDVTLPHEGVWRGSATATDTAGQADLRSATRDFTVNSNAVAPTVTISQPVTMTPPFSVPTVVVTPGQPLTFRGTASDDSRLQNVEITLRNSTTRENLGADGTWGVGITAGNYRISPVSIGAASYNWSYTTPFNLSPGTYTFTVRATDDDGLTTASSNQGRLTLSAQIAGDNPPDGLINPTGTFSVTDPNVPLAGTATDDHGVQSVELAVLDNDTGRYLQDNGTMLSTYNTVTATLGTPGGTSTTWSYPLVLPTSGDYSITALAYDTAGQQDASTSGATSRYKYYPGDAPPGFSTDLAQPIDGSSFDQGKIVVTGRAVDDHHIAKVEVAVVNSLGQYMSSAGTFTSTTPSWRAAFLNSPGSLGSNYSYTTPVIPPGVYTVYVRATDDIGQIGDPPRTATNVTVTQPANTPPVAHASVSCTQNVCSFDGRASTDENPSALTYSWSYGTSATGVNQGTGSGPVPTKTYTAAGTYTVTLTVKDEWNATGTTTLTVPISEPAGNVAPVPTFAWSCLALACTVNNAGTADPNTGDTMSQSWSWGDGGATSTGNAPTHTYAAPGTYTVTLTSTDGWGRSASVSHDIVLTKPAGNVAPTAVFTASCTASTCVMNSTGTNDPDGDAIRYSWSWGDGTAASTAASPSHTYAAAGTYTITLTVTDGWNQVTTATQTVTVPAAAAPGATGAAFVLRGATGLGVLAPQR
jgi:PKD repeat protein